MLALIVFLVSGVLSALLLQRMLVGTSPLLARDDPNQRSLHHEQRPRGGGLTIFISVAVAMFFSMWSIEVEFWLVGLMLCVFGFCAVGFVDDHRSLPVGIRIILGLSLALLMGIAAIATERWILFDEVFLLPEIFVLAPFTLLLFWVVNLFNFMDGADGLIGTQAVLLSFVLGVWFASVGALQLALMNFSLCGAVCGFLIFNYHPARVFLGDVGSLGIGAWIGAMGVVGANRYGFSLEAFLILIGYPFFDASLTLVRRLVGGSNILVAHREHLYQRLILSGFGHRPVALISGALTLILSFLASYVLVNPDYGLWLLIIATGILTAFAGWVYSRTATA